MCKYRWKNRQKNYSILNDIDIVFIPELNEIWSSSFSIKRSHIWKEVDIKHFLKWYSYFLKDIKMVFEHIGIKFRGISIHDDKKLRMKLQKTDKFNIKNNKILKETIKFALNPDIGEKHLIKYNDIIYTINGIHNK